MLSNVLVAVALACGVVLLGITAGLLPTPAPEPVTAVPFVPPTAQPSPKLQPKSLPVPSPVVTGLTLCAAPAQGARLELARATAAGQTFFVWCDGGYELFGLDVTGPSPVVTRLARLPSKMPRPGGALHEDVSADGVADLVAAAAPEEGLVHAAGSGVFLARGRPAGGYEAAHALLEMPVVAMTTAQARPSPAGRDLFVLTRGDAAARRMGELLWLEAGPALVKKRAFPAGLSPRDLRVAELVPNLVPELLVAASEPGRVLVLAPEEQTVAASELPLSDLAELCVARDGLPVLARSTRDLLRVAGGDALRLEPWFRDANVGRCAAADLDGDGALDALATTDVGVVWLRAEGADGSRELALPAGFRALDVSQLPGPGAQVMALVADAQHGSLALLLWSALPWPEADALTFSLEPVRDAAAVAEIPLE